MSDIKENFSLDDFELPPLPKLPPKPGAMVMENKDEETEMKLDDEPQPTRNFSLSEDLPPMPEKTVEDSLEAVAEESTAELEDAVREKFEDSVEGLAAEAEPDDLDLPPVRRPRVEKVDSVELPDEAADDFDLPPITRQPDKDELESLPTPSSDSSSDYNYDQEESKPEEKVRIPEEDTFDFDSDYDLDLENVTPESIGLGDLSAALAPMTTGRDISARNLREKIKMSDMEMELGDAPMLDDLSDEYAAPKKAAERLTEMDKLNRDEKQILQQRLQEDLSRRPENYNSRQSKNMERKLLEEKKLKEAQKGMMISFIPVILGIIAFIVACFGINDGDYKYNSFVHYASFLEIFGALLLLIKSNHSKMFGVIIYAITLLVYVGLGVVMYTVIMHDSDEYIRYMLLALIPTAMNIISILILIKNEYVNTYYTVKFSRK